MSQLLRLMPTLQIQTKRLGIQPLVPNSSQLRLIAEVERHRETGRPIRIICLKARQMGFSTAIEAFLFLNATLFSPGANGLVIAHESSASRALFEKTRMFWETWEFRRKFPLDSSTRQRLIFAGSRSQIKISTAKNIKTARGETIQAAHCSEVAFWDDAETLMVGMEQSVPYAPGTMIFLESTANGVGNWFHEQWQAAEAGDTDYVPMFFPWFEHEEYRASVEGRPELVGQLGRLDAEERWLKKHFEVDDDQLAWRRLTIRNRLKGDSEAFKAEYPSTAEEAFLVSGRNVFPTRKLKACYEPHEAARGYLVREGRGVGFRSDAGGPCYMYLPPAQDLSHGQYFVAGDPTYGIHDRACIQVINRRNFEQVFAWHGVIDPVSFGDELVKVGKYYNDAWISVEVNGPGQATIARLISMNYPKLWQHHSADRLPQPGGGWKALGWASTGKYKGWAVDNLLKLVLDGDLKIHDRMTYAQMQNFAQLSTDPFSPYGNADPKGFDDAVMAMAIACICSVTEGPIGAYEAPPEYNPAMAPAWEAWQQVGGGVTG